VSKSSLFTLPYQWQCKIPSLGDVRGLSGKYPAILNISRTSGLDVIWQPVRGDLTVCPWAVTLCGASQLAVRCCWPSLCTVWPSHSQSPPLQRPFWLWEKPEVAGSHIWAVGGLTDLGDVMLCQKSLHEICRMGRCIVVIKLICSLGHCEWDGHTVHKLSQRRLTADWLAPWDSDCSRMRS